MAATGLKNSCDWAIFYHSVASPLLLTSVFKSLGIEKRALGLLGEERYPILVSYKSLAAQRSWFFLVLFLCHDASFDESPLTLLL